MQIINNRKFKISNNSWVIIIEFLLYSKRKFNIYILVHSKPVLWEPQIRETRNYGTNLIGPNFFPFVSLLFFPAFKGSAYKGIPPIWDEIFGPLNKIVSPIKDFSLLTKFLWVRSYKCIKKRLKRVNLNACLKVNGGIWKFL